MHCSVKRYGSPGKVDTDYLPVRRKLVTYSSHVSSEGPQDRSVEMERLRVSRRRPFELGQRLSFGGSSLVDVREIVLSSRPRVAAVRQSGLSVRPGGWEVR